MHYYQFIETLKTEVKTLLSSPNLKIESITTLKNNGQERIGLVISDPRINISPTIYLEEYFMHYSDGYPLDNIAQDIVDLYKEIRHEQNFDIEQFRAFQNVKPFISYKLINAEQNKTLLTQLPHKIFNDFAITFYVLYETESFGTATIPITHDLLKLWNLNVDSLFSVAAHNMPLLLPAIFQPMYDAISDLIKDLPLEYIHENNPLYVLTNTKGCFGASCILYDGILEKIAEELNENYYIIPSSIHETLILPESKSPSRSELNEMVREINRTQVSPEEILSDFVYFYDCSLKYMY